MNKYTYTYTIEIKIGNEWQDCGVSFSTFAPADLWMRTHKRISYLVTKRDGLAGATVRIMKDGAVNWPVK